MYCTRIETLYGTIGGNLSEERFSPDNMHKLLCEYNGYTLGVIFILYYAGGKGLLRRN